MDGISNNFVGEILKRFTVSELFVGLIVSVIAVVVWRWIGAKQPEKKKLKQQLTFVVPVVFVGVCAIVVLHFWSSWFPPIGPFPEGSAGILVLRFAGDDKNSAQHDLVDTLDRELNASTTGQTIEVRAIQETVDVSKGLVHAHADAREIGRKFNALLVVWGDLVGTSKFHPRITIAHELGSRVIGEEHTLAVQDISQLNLPVELISEPIFLAQVCLGCDQYRYDNHAEAIKHFRAALALKGLSQDELKDTYYLAGTCLLYLSQGQTETPEFVEEAIDDFQAALTAYAKVRAMYDCAETQLELGIAYGNLRTGDRAANLRKALDYYTAALEVLTQDSFPRDWAVLQINIGDIYYMSSTGDRAANLQKVIDCYAAALSVLTEATFPMEWATLQYNLGKVYRDLPTGDRATNLQRAIDYYIGALRVMTEAACPHPWATTQYNLGNAYGLLPTGDRSANLQKAIDCYTAALRGRTQANFPQDWADTQVNLGNAYSQLQNADRPANIQKAIDHFTEALRVRTQTRFPHEWALILYNLANAYQDLPSGDRAANLQKAIDYYIAALSVLTEVASPEEWASAQTNLGNAYCRLPNGDRAANLKKAIDCHTAALRVFTKAAFPAQWALTQNNLQSAYSLMPTMDSADLPPVSH